MSIKQSSSAGILQQTVKKSLYSYKYKNFDLRFVGYGDPYLYRKRVIKFKSAITYMIRKFANEAHGCVTYSFKPMALTLGFKCTTHDVITHKLVKSSVLCKVGWFVACYSQTFLFCMTSSLLFSLKSLSRRQHQSAK